MARNTRRPIALAAVALASASAAIAVPAMADGSSQGSQPSVTSEATPGASSDSGVDMGSTDTTAPSEDADAQAPGQDAQGQRGPERGGPGDHGRGGPGGDHDHGGRGEHGPGPSLEAAAEKLGLTTDQLREKLGTQTLGEVADAQGVDRTELVDAMMAGEKARLTAFLDEQLPQPGECPDATRLE